MKKRVAFAYNFNDMDWLGGKNYFASLFAAIEVNQPQDLEFIFFTGKKTCTVLPEEFPWLEVVRTPWMDRFHPMWLLRQLFLRTSGSDPLFEFFLAHHHIDILSHSVPLGRNSNIKSLPWLYDFQFMHLPEYWQSKHIRWAQKRYMDACRHGDGLILSSNDAAGDLKQFAPWCSLPVHILQFVSNPINFSQIISKETLIEKYSLPSTYVYLPNQFWTNKNHRLVIDALAILKSEGKAVTVVCTGKLFDGRKPEYFDELMMYREKQGLIDEFRVLGIVPYTDLQALMWNSCAVINPSRFEGWSTTVEEAKTLHRRLLLSDINVHREQSPNYAYFFGVDDAPELARLLAVCVKEKLIEISEDDICKDYAFRLEKFGQVFLQAIRSTLLLGKRL
jgi:glycosyltransferase involved in cell wall biosynthesis